MTVLAANVEEHDESSNGDGTTKALVAISTTKVSFTTIIVWL